MTDEYRRGFNDGLAHGADPLNSSPSFIEGVDVDDLQMPVDEADKTKRYQRGFREGAAAARKLRKETP